MDVSEPVNPAQPITQQRAAISKSSSDFLAQVATGSDEIVTQLVILCYVMSHQSSSPSSCSASGILVNAPIANSVQPIARFCSSLSFSDSKSAMPAPSITSVPRDETDLRDGDFMLFHRLFHSFNNVMLIHHRKMNVGLFKNPRNTASALCAPASSKRDS